MDTARENVETLLLNYRRRSLEESKRRTRHHLTDFVAARPRALFLARITLLAGLVLMLIGAFGVFGAGPLTA